MKLGLQECKNLPSVTAKAIPRYSGVTMAPNDTQHRLLTTETEGPEPKGAQHRLLTA